jgi:thymidine phosphorylase
MFKLRVKKIDLETGGVSVVTVFEDFARANDLHEMERVLVQLGNKQLVAVVDTSEKIIGPGEIGLFEDVWKKLGANDGDLVEITPIGKPESTKFIRKKMDREELFDEEMRQIVQDIVDEKLTDVELVAFVSASYMAGLTLEETVSLTKSIVETGGKLNLKKKPILDKHSIGGVAGNRVTMLIVPIIASLGLTMPKTSSRAITSPAGTADTMEVLADVSFSIEELTEIVKKTNGCIVWGGAINLAAADDKLIRVRHPLALDPEGMMLASVDWTEPIFVRRNGEVKRIAIGEFVDPFMDGNQRIDLLEESVALDKGEYEVLAADKDFKISWKPLTCVIRHGIWEPLYELELETGRKVRITSSHSVFILKDGKVVSRPTSQIQKGDYVVVPSNLPLSRDKARSDINLFGELLKLPENKLKWIHVHNLPPKIFDLLKPRVETCTKYGIDRSCAKDWEKKGYLPLSIIKKIGAVELLADDQNILLSGRNGVSKHSRVLKLEEPLVRLLGFYTAEGCIDSREKHVILTFGSHENDRPLVSEALDTLDKLGIKFAKREENSKVEILISDKIFVHLIKDIFGAGMNCEEKRIPEVIFNLSKELQQSYLNAAFLGDGHLAMRPRNLQYTYVTKSKTLACDMAYLLLGQGILASIKNQSSGAFAVIVSGSQKETAKFLIDGSVRFENRLKLYNKFIKRKVEVPVYKLLPKVDSGFLDLYDRFCRRSSGLNKKGNTTLLTNMRVPRTLMRALFRKAGSEAKTQNKLFNSDFAFVRVDSIKRVEPKADYVYDLSVEGYGNFVGGFGGVLLHNSIMAKKLAVGATHVVFDLPIGEEAKLQSLGEARHMEREFVKMGERFKVNVKTVITDGNEPIGRGVGPLLEARDVLWALRNDKRGPEDLKTKSTMLAGQLLELCGKAKSGEGQAIAERQIQNGAALKKMLQIIEMQGGDPKVDPDKLQPAQYTIDYKAERSGKIIKLSNGAISKIARATGAPVDQEAGIFLHKRFGDVVREGDTIFTAYSKSERNIDRVIRFINELNPIVVK